MTLLKSARWCQLSYNETVFFGGLHTEFTFNGNNAYLFVDPESRRHIIVIEGTDEPQDWLCNFDVPLTRDIITGVGCHAGFAKAAVGLWSQIQQMIDPTFTLWLTGHSLGGAVATLMALQALREGYKVVALDTFGAPRPGDQAMARELESFLPKENVKRVYLGHDLVTRVPFSRLGYWHPLGTPIHILPNRIIAGVNEWRKERALMPNTRERINVLRDLMMGRVKSRLGSVRDHAISGYVDGLGGKF